MMKRNFGKNRRQSWIKPKECSFCVSKEEPDYKVVEGLRRFLTERGKIIGRERDGLCRLHQKKLTEAIKRARLLAILPFTVKAS